MILDNGWASRGQKSRFKSSLPTGTDGKGREAALAATEGGGEGLPQGGEPRMFLRPKSIPKSPGALTIQHQVEHY